MQKIDRGKGITKSERRLAKLADKTFLDLWAYPNTFNDKDMGKGQGKELCDLLVMCGDDVIIFSDKHINWPDGDIDIAWNRWYRRAVTQSVKQIRGAERWLRSWPERIFINPECTTPLPVRLPNPEKLRVHGIAVAGGARKAASKFLDDRDGSLLLYGDRFNPDRSDNQFPPFGVGDPDPDGSFIHVVDAESLELLLKELDTIADFVAYLSSRANAFRNKHLGVAAGEAELLAVYLSNQDASERNYLPTPKDIGGVDGIPVVYHPGQYEKLKGSPQYRMRTELNNESYGWDKLILRFSKNLLRGTSVAIAGMEPQIETAELALRKMALEDRVSRRGLAYAVGNGYKTSEAMGKDRFARIVPPFEGCADPECGYVFFFLAYRGNVIGLKGYEYYREARVGLLKAYCQVALYKNRNLKRMVGIGMDASAHLTGRKGGSEDLMLLEITEWTPKLEAETKTLSREAEILLPETTRESRVQQRSFTDLNEDGVYSGNRKERRAARSRSKKR